ncbi:hypothetical protein HanRHA438_Chr08g0337061 [Helianthus annuus]|nr:hypothetical protein HanHA300_Chr08g0269401 [Helianthus annuus]KAJ0545650.1 hypothetical protein HanIR_Chr08g0352151 [Helianthus annuus]KAJ0552527.1 hypothetical protein HanHA89_Chr08g0286231 [Helianthus annuus]KAJ0718224.1 hypothetical protein HanLR1_Chr08g0268271 [Helianthus annuus]KAJ0721455.1 hypothetical protein HanOQP8_Chr08g0275751 [Helianthus annuus]
MSKLGINTWEVFLQKIQNGYEEDGVYSYGFKSSFKAESVI